MDEQTCIHCGCVLSDEDARVFDGEYYCEECLETLTVLCECCGKRILREDNEGNDDMILCSSCYTNHYVACERCGRLIPLDEACYADDDEEYPYCSECVPSESIYAYRYKPDPVFYGEDNLYFGVELEVDEGGESSGKADQVLEIANQNDWHLYCKRDGSLKNGFELVTHPMTLAYHQEKMPWAEILHQLQHMGYRSHQTNTCGLHVHVNRSAFGETPEEQETVIARILYFVEMHWDYLLRFSRRTEEQLERWAARYGLKDTPKEVLDNAKGGWGRYTCINLCNRHTIEFRIFRGTLKYNTLIATLQMVSRICNVALSMSDEEIRELTWAGFVARCHEPELISYLKERHICTVQSAESEVK